MVQEGELAENVVAHPGNFTQEEDQEDTGADTESAGNSGTKFPKH